MNLEKPKDSSNIESLNCEEEQDQEVVEGIIIPPGLRVGTFNFSSEEILSSESINPQVNSTPKPAKPEPRSINQATMVDELLKRTYMLKKSNIKRLQEIKVFLFNDLTGYSEIINAAIEHYYECLKVENP